MSIRILLLIVVCTLVAHAEAQGTCDTSEGAEDCNTTETSVQEPPDDPTTKGTDDNEDAAVSPWQGNWSGSEMSSLGTRVSLRVRITVTNKTISGTWNARGAGSKPISGQVNGKEATISIRQGGSLVKATLVDQDTFKYSGIRGYGTLTRQR